MHWSKGGSTAAFCAFDVKQIPVSFVDIRNNGFGYDNLPFTRYCMRKLKESQNVRMSQTQIGSHLQAVGVGDIV